MYYLLISSEHEKDREYYLLASAQSPGHSSQAMTLFHRNIASSITSRAVSSELLLPAWQEGMAFLNATVGPQNSLVPTPPLMSVVL